MPDYLLETDFCIHVLRDKPRGARTRFEAERNGLAISTITTFELLRGAFKSARPIEGKQQVEALADRVEVLPLDSDAASHAADIRATLERAGRTIGAYDLLIAGQARSRGLTVVTGNIREFSRVDGLRCEDWLREETTS